MVVVTAVTVVVMRKEWKPLVWLAVLGFSSIGIALITWGPFLLASLQGAEQSGDTAMHYLPYDGTLIPLPILDLLVKLAAKTVDLSTDILLDRALLVSKRLKPLEFQLGV